MPPKHTLIQFIYFSVIVVDFLLLNYIFFLVFLHRNELAQSLQQQKLSEFQSPLVRFFYYVLNELLLPFASAHKTFVTFTHQLYYNFITIQT